MAGERRPASTTRETGAQANALFDHLDIWPFEDRLPGAASLVHSLGWLRRLI